MNRRNFIGKALAGVAGLAAGAFGLLAAKKTAHASVIKSCPPELKPRSFTHHILHEKQLRKCAIIRKVGADPSTAKIGIWEALLHRDGLHLGDKVTVKANDGATIFVGYVVYFEPTAVRHYSVICHDARGLLKPNFKRVSSIIERRDLDSRPTMHPGWTEKEQRSFAIKTGNSTDRTPYYNRDYVKAGKRWCQLTVNTVSKDQYPDVDLAHPPIAYAAKHKWTWGDLWNYMANMQGERNA